MMVPGMMMPGAMGGVMMLPGQMPTMGQPVYG